jgi:Na+/H+ antiporter NhaD/arsenite permease-like protein
MLAPAALAALAIFAVAYALFAARETWRTPIAGVAAALVLAVGLVPVSALRPTGFAARGSVIEWNTLALLAGLFVFTGVLGALGFYRAAALWLVDRTRGRPLVLPWPWSGSASASRRS